MPASILNRCIRIVRCLHDRTQTDSPVNLGDVLFKTRRFQSVG